VSHSPSATILLLRHGHTEAIGRYLAGRTPGLGLSEAGRGQASALVARLSGQPIVALYSSPMERCLATMTPLARARGLEIRLDPDLIESDFGEWTGRRFQDLETLPEWQAFNARRATASVPGGESAPAVQARVVAAVERIRRAHPGGTVVVCSHADPIRYALLHARSLPLDLVHEVTVPPASITRFG
jgi:broad specificity phosphatase PhoE